MILREPLPGRIAGMRIVEGYTKTPGTLGRVVGIFGQCDVLNKNSRVYERALWEHVLNEERYRKAVEDKTLLGEPDHPETRTQSAIREGSHTVVEVTLDDQGNLRGVVEVFDNPLGRMVWPMLQAGVRLGFSTRGDGDLIEDARSGHTRVDPKTYEWHGVDFVLNPSFVAAMPESVTEDVKKRVRMALNEAVGEKKLKEGVREDVEALLESKVVKEVAGEQVEQRVNWILSASVDDFATPQDLEDSAAVMLGYRHITVRPGEAYGTHQMMASAGEGPHDTKALESALSQLRNEKEKIATLIEDVAKLEREGYKLTESVAEGRKRRAEYKEALKESKKKLTEAQQRLGRANAKLKRLGVNLKEAEDTTKVDGLKRVLKENQEAHLELVEKHRRVLDASKQLEGKSRKIIEGLRDRVNEAERKATEAESALTEQRGAEPKRVKDANLEQYKRLKSEGVEMPGEVKQLLERAQTEAEVDALIETFTASQASRYDYLPLGLDSRRKREEIMRAVDEQTEDERENEADPDREETARVVESQLRR